MSGAAKRRVVVTGIGIVSPIGISREGLWQGLQSGKSAVRTVTRFDPAMFRSHNAAEVDDFHPTDFLEQKRARRLERFGHFAVASARLALDDSGIDLAGEDRERFGSIMGSALGGVAYAESQMHVFMEKGLKALDPALALMVFGGAASCNIAIELGLQGPNSTNAMSCASGTIAIGDGFREIRDDYADVMLCGASEAPLAPLTFGAFAIIRAMSTRNDEPQRASRPFDRDRDGFVMGEGGAVLVLEEYARAHMTAPRPDGSQAARSIRRALDDGHVAPADVAYVNAHGSSTPLNDPTETLALKHAFGDHASRLQVSSTKGYYGHALGASGAFEAAICALALERHWLPPTVNLDYPDANCDLDYIPRQGRDAGVEYALSNSFGFGGINAALLFRRAD